MSSLSRSRRVLVLLVMGVALSIGIVACGGSDDGGSGTTQGETTAGGTAAEDSTIGLMVIDLKSAFFAEQVKAVRELVEAEGGKLEVMDPGGDPAKQLQLAQTWLDTGKVDAMVGSVVDVAAFQSVFDEAEEKEVPIVMLGFAPVDGMQPTQANVEVDFPDWGYQIGTAMSKCIDDRLGGEGEVVVLTSNQFGGPILQELLDGERKGLAENPGANIVAEPDAPDRLKALQAVKNVLQAHPDVNVLVGPSDDAVLGGLQALEAAGKDPKTELCVTGTGGDPEGEEKLESGAYYAQADIQLPLIYSTALDAAWGLIEDPKNPEYSAKVLPTKVKMRFHDEL